MIRFAPSSIDGSNQLEQTGFRSHMDPIAGRYLPPLFVSAGISFGQFWLMTILIQVEEEPPVEKPRTVVEIVEGERVEQRDQRISIPFRFEDERD
jgi:hypothetical protein